MPGLSVALGDAGAIEGAVAGSLDTTEWFDHYHAEQFDVTSPGPPAGSGDGDHASQNGAHPSQSGTQAADSASDVILGTTGYEGYPIHRVDTDHGTVVLEGRLYDVDADLDDQLEDVAALIAADDTDGLREWIAARDGDFLIAVVHGEQVSLVSDAFARLPAYCATIDGTVVCSRELAFVREFARRRDASLSLDRLAVGQLLAFGYPLGTRTPFAGVRSIPPGSLVRLRADPDEPESADSVPGTAADLPGVEIDSLYEHDFETCAHADRSVADNADELVDRIRTACRRRADPDRQTVVSLSGGLDSRTVAAAYATGSAPTKAATFQRRGDRNSPEVAAAGAVAAHLDLDWTLHEIDSSPERRETLLATKQGMNYLGMAFILDFFEQLRDRHGTTTYVTGDGGDKLLVGLEPASEFDSTAALVEHVIDANSRLPLSDAAAIANVDPDAIRAAVAERLDSYPEADRSRRYVHFLIRERGINFLLHGEDRNRYYAWSVSPFYALPVFEYAMNCPDDQKAYRRLQSAILDRLDPGLVDLPYPNYGAPISTRRYRAKQFVFDALERYPGVRDRVVDLVTSDTADARSVADAIRADLPRLTAAGLSAEATTDVISDPGAYDAGQLEYLATVTSLASTLGQGGDVERPARAPSRGAHGGESGAPGAGTSATTQADATPDGAGPTGPGLDDATESTEPAGSDGSSVRVER
ncbi:asparagine synthase-related protein [Salinarchaeum laminariae]|uniref:asparagine synthase-related protein n=1 Tax=Salinarchaeum laminariae TaxID=869888 RepID=UPI0020BFB87F|nr:asparagine synthase-related protein [Salinarchaeum laminariae]